MKKTLPVKPFLTSRVISARASSTSARTSVETWVVASLIRSPIDGSADLACGSVNGIVVRVLGTPFLPSALLTDGPLSSSPGSLSSRFMLPCGGSVRTASGRRPRRRATRVRIANFTSGPITLGQAGRDVRRTDGSGAVPRAHRCFSVAMVAFLLAVMGPIDRAAAADVRIPLGGGAGIVVNGDTMCTLTTIGGDATGALIGFTSAHCGSPGAQVTAEGAEGAGVLGTMVAGNDNLDYAVIRFDPAKVTPVANFNGFLISGIGPDPAFGEIACKQGRTTGNSCGVTWGMGQSPGTIVMQVCGQPGDSGAPVTVNNLLVGMIHGAFSDNLPTCIIKYIPLHTPAVVQSFNAILGDINAKHRPGAGFSPLPG